MKKALHKIPLTKPLDLFILRLILKIIDTRTRITRVESTKNHDMPIIDIKFDPSLFKNKYNFRNIGIKKLKKYFIFLHKKEIIFPATYYTGGIWPLENFEYWYDTQNKPSVIMFVNPTALSAILKILKESENKYILRSKRITVNIFTGLLEVNLKNAEPFNRTIHITNINLSLLVELLSKKYISIYKINKIGGTSKPEQKIKRLRSLLGISKYKDPEVEDANYDFGINIERKNNKYVLIEN